MSNFGFAVRPPMMRLPQRTVAPSWHQQALTLPIRQPSPWQQAAGRSYTPADWHARHQAQVRARQPQQITNNYYTQQAPPVATAMPSPPIVVPPSMPEPQPSVQPASPTADLGPTQDAAADAVATPAEHPGHAWGRKIIIGLVVAGAAFGGYKIWQKHKKHAPAGHGHSGMHGFRRRSRRRR